MKYQKYYAAIEAVLFASGEPISLDRLAAAVGLELQLLREIMIEFAKRYESEEHGIQVIVLDDCYQFCTKTALATQIKNALEMKRTVPLSQAALEVLAVIAYNQPVTKGFIEQVRGVDSSSIVNSLNEKGLIEEAGRLEVPGRPVSYRTTAHFLRSFGMESLKELPPLPEET